MEIQLHSHKELPKRIRGKILPLRGTGIMLLLPVRMENLVIYGASNRLLRGFCEFIKAKGLVKPAVFGFSDGGNVALQLEVMYPGTLGAIVTGGANIFVEGALIPSFAEGFLSQPTDNPLVIMLQTEPDMTVEDMHTIKAPSLIMSGEHDLIEAAHTRLIGDNIPDGEARIIPGEDHGSYICNSPKLAPIILEFFDRIGY